MKRLFGVVLVLIGGLAAGPRLRAQTPAGNNSNANQKKPAPSQPPANSFPEDESSVPVLPSKNTPDLPPGSFDGSIDGRAVLPAGDVDPVESPDGAPGVDNSGPSSGFSSSVSGTNNVMAPPPDEEQPTKHGKHRQDDQIEPEHHETAAEDENVGRYYLDNKDWHAALSRFQSAMVLDPENPDVYWGLAEANRHLGNYVDARTNYLKVMEYDPDSKHAKEAKKTLSEPELANAKSAASNASPQK